MTDSINNLLASHPLFGTMVDEYRQRLASYATAITPDVGHYLLVAGKAADTFYLIEGGTIMIEQATEDGETTNIEELGRDEIIGWSWMIPPQKWQFDALVTKSGPVWEFDAKGLRTECDKDPAFGFELSLRITHALVHRLQNTRIRLVEEAAL
jgi:CRP-like cAMP-binding protein